MKICFVLNAIETEGCGSSIAMIVKAHQRGHEVYVMGVGNFNFQHDAPISLTCKCIPKKHKIKDNQKFLEVLQSDKWDFENICSSTLDVLFIRNNPTEETFDRHWAEQSGVAFGRMIQNQGVLVLNDAYAMTNAFIDKLYFEELPGFIKPKSIVTRSKEDILAFYEEMGNQMVLKPLEGSGGQHVYLIDKHEKNTNQIIDTIINEGYVIAQEYLPEVKHGDVRVLLMNGRILEQDGHYGIIRRVGAEGEFRSNFSQGASADTSELTPAMQQIVDITAPKLIRDGLFFVGLDIVDDKLIEINVLSPGGLQYFPQIGLPDFTDSIIAAIERKLDYKKHYKNSLSNQVLATMD